jgi:DNA (cytosine-5)-methyltransferase 1
VNLVRLPVQGRRSRGAHRQAVSLFSGAGGLDLGLEAAGWSVLAQVEMDEDCTGTLRRHAEHLQRQPQIITSSVEKVDPQALRRSLRLRRGELELLAGGPPCQPFTTTGLRQAISDRRASTAFPSYLRFVSEFLPRTLLMENVDGMLSVALRHRRLALRGSGGPPLAWEERKGTFLHWLLHELVALGYSMSWGVVDASDYGVPQRRQRAVLIGTRSGDPCFLPSATHGGPRLPRCRTLRDALRGVSTDSPVQPLSERKRRVFDMIPPGGNWRELSERVRKQTMGAAFHAEGGKGGWWRRLSWDAPAPTILGMPDHSSTALIHPDETRCLSVAECAALQSFPAWVAFAGTPRSQYQQIGNAVPPLLGEALGRALDQHLAGVRTPVPPEPLWRQESANRRIGTHGWVVPGTQGPLFHFHVRLRDDHVWATEPNGQQRLSFG